MNVCKILLGGTFDPVHDGHLNVARHVREQSGCTVHLLPTSQSPFKQTGGATAAQRLAMLQLAIADQSGVAIDTHELAQTGVHYTVDTWRYFQAQKVVPIFVLGWDAFCSLPRWQEADTLMAHGHFIVVDRAPADATLCPELQQRWQARQALTTDSLRDVFQAPESGKLFSCAMARVDLSSTAVRAELASGKQPTGLPAAVFDYIQQQGLYRTTAGNTPADSTRPRSGANHTGTP